MKNFDLGKTYTIELIPSKQAVTATITTLTRTIEDDGQQVVARVHFDELPEPMLITLWDSLVYANVQNWTDEMANNRILEILNLQ